MYTFVHQSGYKMVSISVLFVCCRRVHSGYHSASKQSFEYAPVHVQKYKGIPTTYYPHWSLNLVKYVKVRQ